MKSWQVPISNQHVLAKYDLAHLFELTRQRGVQVRAACGKMVTPYFAMPPRLGVRRCKFCVRSMNR